MAVNVILLPGGVMPADLAYAALLAEFGPDVHAVTKDLELYAEPTPPPTYSLADEIDGILRVAGDAGFDDFHLVGYSGGGASSLAFVAAHPERVRTLALFEPAWMGNEGLGAEEEAIWQEAERLVTLPDAEMMSAFVAFQLAPGVEPTPPPPGPPPPWMASRPPGLRALITVFRSTTLDLDALRAYDRPVYFGLGGRSNPDYYANTAERAGALFRDFTLDIYPDRHHFDPPHRIEPTRTAAALEAHWARG